MDKEQLIKTFIELAHASPEESKFILESHNWDLEEAMATYFSEKSSHQSAPVKAVTPQTTSSSSSKPAQSKRGISGFSDIQSTNEDDEDTVNWFTGGEKSGIQVQAPKKNKNELLNDIMDSAKRSGAQSIDEFNSKNNASFTGTGMKLGQSNQESKAVAPKVKKEETQLKITFWKNGFTVGDSALRSYSDPANAAFLESIKSGQMPRELSYLGSEALVDLVDSRHEEWKEPPKVLQPFSGGGYRLGSTSTTPSSSSSSSSTSSTVSSAPKESIKVDESRPTTSIQVRCMDGSRIVGKFNYTHKVSDIRLFIDGSKPGSKAYDLYSSFPQKCISDESQTIENAGLLNSVVIQKAK